MRKTNLMLIAAIVASPLAMALGDIDNLDLTIDDSFKYLNEHDIKLHATDKYKEENSFNTDRDVLVLDHVGNTFKKDIDIGSETNLHYKFDLDKEIDFYLAKSKLDGYVMKNSVNYSAAGIDCCSGTISLTEVVHENMMQGSFSGAAGVNESAQNVGNNSMLQQATSTNAALVGHQ